MKIETPPISDYHTHVRDGDLLARVAPESARYCGRLLAMPNLTPPVTGPQDAARYCAAIRAVVPAHLDVLLAMKLVPQTTPGLVSVCAAMPYVAAFKLYPAGVTTNSHDGIPASVIDDPVSDQRFCDVLAEMERTKLVLCLHGEHPDEDDPFEREAKFHDFIRWVVSTYPNLRVVVEHITRAATVELLHSLAWTERIAATITPHHMMIHRGHFYGSAASAAESRFGCGDGKCHPHLHCWPAAGSPADREAIARAATSGAPYFFLGSDSAPHEVGAKVNACGCAGIFGAPVLPEALAQVFSDRDAVAKLPAFVAESGDRFYRRQPVRNAPSVRLVRRPWVVPERVAGVVPFLAGRTLDWQVESGG